MPSCAYCETRGLGCIYNAHRDRSRGGGRSEFLLSHPSPSESVSAEAELDDDAEDVEHDRGYTDDRATQADMDVDGAEPYPEEFHASEPVTQVSAVGGEEDPSSSSPCSPDYTDSEESLCGEDEGNLESGGYSYSTTSAPTSITWASFPSPYRSSLHALSPRHRISIRGLLQHVSTESHMPISDVRSEKPTSSTPLVT